MIVRNSKEKHYRFKFLHLYSFSLQKGSSISPAASRSPSTEPGTRVGMSRWPAASARVQSPHKLRFSFMACTILWPARYAGLSCRLLRRAQPPIQEISSLLKPANPLLRFSGGRACIVLCQSHRQYNLRHAANGVPRHGGVPPFSGYALLS